MHEYPGALFLDFDGVVNYDEMFERLARSDTVTAVIDRAAVARINRIVRAAGPYIVVSSAWRLHYPLDTLQAFLNVYGFEGTLQDVTVDLSREVRFVGAYGHSVRRERGDEIGEWLTRNAWTKPFVILDDNPIGGVDPERLQPRFVRTNSTTGLTDDDVVRVIDLLTNPQGTT